MSKIEIVKKILSNPKKTFVERYIILFYELGCFFQKKNKIIADFFFKFPYFIYSFFGFRKLSFAKTCFLFFSDKAKIDEINLAENYDRFFSKIKNKKLRIIEIGIGGHTMEDRGGSSLRSFATFFKNSKIFGIDLINKQLHERSRIKTFQGSQVDEDFLVNICNTHGPFDIILDDGSHFVEHQKKSFEIMFDHLNEGGIYIIEDVGSSYIKYLGGSQDISSQNNLIKYFLDKTHNVYSYYIKKNNNAIKNKFIEISSVQYFSSPSNDVASILIEKHKKIKKSNDVDFFDLSLEEIKRKDPESPMIRKSKDGVMIQKK